MLIRLSLLLLTLLLPLTAQSKAKVNFERQIFPIFEKNCIKCHRATYVDKTGRRRRPKGRVMLDTLANIQKSKRGKLLIAHKPDDSYVIESITLPDDDEDRMPPAKESGPLAKRDIALIRKWIEQGADYGSWTGEAAGSSSKSKSKTKRPSKRASSARKKRRGPSPLITLSKSLTPVSATKLKAFEGSPFQVRSVGDNNPLLTVTCCGQTDDVDDDAIAMLAPIADHIFELDLARSQVSDACCTTLATMKRLTKLDLRQTKVSNAGVKELAKCRELRSLNLFDTATGDYALLALASLKKLERLYLYQTEVTAKAVVRLREAVPSLRIVTSMDLPEPMEEGNKGRRRRR